MIVFKSLCSTLQSDLREKGEWEHMTTLEYKKMLIENILEWQPDERFTEEELKKKSIRVLEIIHDNIGTYEEEEK